MAERQQLISPYQNSGYNSGNQNNIRSNFNQAYSKFKGLFDRDNRQQAAPQQRTQAGYHQANLGEELAARAIGLGEKIFNISGFDEEDYNNLFGWLPNREGKDTNIFGVAGGQKNSFGEVAQSAFDFLKSVPLGMASALPSAAGKFYETFTGSDIMRSVKQDDGTHLISDTKADAGERAATGVDALIDSLGLAVGASGTLLRGLSNGARVGRIAASSAARATQAGRTASALDKMKAANEQLSKIYNPDFIKNAGTAAQVAWDVGEEAGEEFVQQQMQNIYYGNGTWTGDDSVWDPKNEMYGEALGAAALGGIGGGVMTGGMRGIQAAVNHSRRKASERSEGENSDKAGFSETANPNIPTITDRPGDVSPDYLGIMSSAADNLKTTTPGVSPTLNITPSADVKTYQNELSLGTIKRELLADNKNARSIAAKFGYAGRENAFRDLVLNGENSQEFQNIARQGGDTTLGMALTRLALENNAYLTLWKEPSTNYAGAMRSYITRITDNDSQYVGVNPLINKLINADLDGDKVKISWDDSVAQAYGPSEMLINLASGANRKPVYDKDYTYFNKSPDGKAAGLAAIDEIVGLTEEDKSDLRSAYESFIDERDDSLKEEKETAFLDKLVKATNTAAGSATQGDILFGDVFDRMQLKSLEMSDEQANTAYKNVVLGAIDMVKEGDLTGDFVNTRTSGPASPISTIEILRISQAFNGDFRSFPKIMFRQNQGPALHLKRKITGTGEMTDVVVNDMYDLTLAMTARLINLGENPADAIEGVFKTMVYQDAEFQAGAQFDWDKFTSWLSTDFAEAYEKNAVKRNAALKEARMSEESLILPFDAMVKKTKLESEEERLQAFLDIYGDAISAEDIFPSAKGTGMNLKDYVTYANARRFSTSLISNGPAPTFENALMQRLGKLNVGTYARHNAQLMNMLHELRDGIRVAKLNTTDGITYQNYASWAQAATTIAGDIGISESMEINFGDMNTILDNEFFRAIIDAANNQTDFNAFVNAVATMDLAGKYANVMDIMGRIHNGEQLDVEVYTELLTSEILKNLGTSHLHSMFVSNLLEMVENGNFNFNQSLLAKFMDLNRSWNDKVKMYEAMCDGINNVQPLLSAINVIDSTPIMMSSRMNALRDAQRAASQLAKVNDDIMREDAKAALDFCNNHHVSFLEVAKQMYKERGANVSLDIFSGYLYTQIHGFSFNVMEKSKSEPGSQAYYQQIAMLNGHPLNPFMEDITGAQFNSMTVDAFLKDPKHMCSVLFDPKAEYQLTIPGKDGVVRMNQAAFYEAVVGSKLSDEVNGINEAEFMAFLNALPSATTWIVPQSLVTTETTLGVQTVEVARYNLRDAVEDYVERNSNEPNRNLIREAFAKEVMTNKKLTEIFTMTLSSFDDGTPIYHVFSPNDFNNRIKKAFNDFVDNLTDMFVIESKKAGGNVTDSETLKSQIDKISRAAFGAYTDTSFAYMQDIAGQMADMSVNSLASNFSNTGSVVAGFVEQAKMDVAKNIAVAQVLDNISDEFPNLSPLIESIRSGNFRPAGSASSLRAVGDSYDIATVNDYLNGSIRADGSLSNLRRFNDSAEQIMRFYEDVGKRFSDNFAGDMDEYVSRHIDDFIRSPYIRSYLITMRIARERSETYRSNSMGDDRTRQFSADVLKNDEVYKEAIGILNRAGASQEDISRVSQVFDMNKVSEDFANNTKYAGMFNFLDTLIDNDDLLRGIDRYVNPLMVGDNVINPNFDNGYGLEDDYNKLLQIAKDVHLSSSQDFSEAGIRRSLEKCYDTSRSIEERTRAYKKLNEQYQNGIIRAAFGELSTNPLREFNRDAITDVSEANDTLTNFFADMMRNGTANNGKNLRQLADSVESPTSSPKLPAMHAFDVNLATIVSRASFEGYAGYVVPMVGTEGTMQPIVQILSALKSIPNTSCNAQAVPIGGTGTAAELDTNPESYYGKNIVINGQAIAGNEELMLSVLEQNVDGQGGCLLVFNERIKGMISRGIIDRDTPVMWFDPHDCLGGPCAHHDMKAYDGSGVRRNGATDAENDFMAVPNILQFLVSTAMEARLLKAKKAYNRDESTILHLAPTYAGGKALSQGNNLVANAADGAAIARAFLDKKTELKNYFQMIFDGKDADGHPIQDTGFGDIGFGEDQAWALANFFCRSITITFADGSGNTQYRTVDASLTSDPAAWQQAITPPQGYSIQRIDANMTGLTEISNKVGMAVTRAANAAKQRGDQFTMDLFREAVRESLFSWDSYSTIDEQGNIKPDVATSHATMADVLKHIQQRRRGYAAVNMATANESTALQKLINMTREDAQGNARFGINAYSKYNANAHEEEQIHPDQYNVYQNLSNAIRGEMSSDTDTVITAAKIGKKFRDKLDGNISTRMLESNYGKAPKTINGRYTAILFAPDETTLTARDVESAMNLAIANGQGIYMPSYAYEMIKDNPSYFPPQANLYQRVTNASMSTGAMFKYIDIPALGRNLQSLPSRMKVGRNKLGGKVLVVTESPARISDSGSIINIDSIQGCTWNNVNRCFEIPFSAQFSKDMNGYGVTYALATEADMSDINTSQGRGGNLDIDVVKKTLDGKLSSQEIRNAVNRYISRVMHDKTINGPNKTVSKYDCVCIIKRTDSMGTVDYAPVFMDDTDIGRTATITGDIVADGAKASFYYHGSDQASIGDNGKLVVRNEPYKTMFRVSNPEQFMTIADGSGTARRADIHVDVGALRGRILGLGENKLETSLHYATFMYKTSMWETFDKAGNGHVRNDLRAQISNDSELLAQLINGEAKAYRRVLEMGGPLNDVTGDVETMQLRERQNQTICKLISRCLDLEGVPFSEVFAKTRYIDNGYKTSLEDFTHRVVFSGFTSDELLLFYNAICPNLCPEGFWGDDTGKVLDNEGNMLQYDPNLEQYRRVETFIADHDFIAPEINTTISGTGMRSSQTFLDNLLQHGPREEDLEEYIANVESTLGDVGSEYHFLKDRKRSDLIERIQHGDINDYTIAQQRMLENRDGFKNAIIRDAKNARYKRKLMQYINTINNNPPIITNTQEADSGVVDITNDVSRVNEALGLGYGTAIEGISEFQLRQIVAAALGWTMGTDGNFGTNINYETFSNCVNQLITEINGHALPLSSMLKQLSPDDRINTGILPPQIVHVFANAPAYSGTTEQQMIDSLVEQAVGQRNLAESQTDISQAGKKKAIKDLINSYLYMYERFDEIESSMLLGDMSQTEYMKFCEDFNDIINRDSAQDKQTFTNMLQESQRAMENIAAWQRRRDEKRVRVTKFSDTVSRNRNVTSFGKFAMNASMLNKMMIFLNPLMLPANITDRFVKNIGNRSIAAMLAANIETETLLERTNGRGVPHDVIKAAAKDQLLKRALRTFIKARITGREINELVNATSVQALEEAMEAFESDKGFIEKAFEKSAYFASGGDFGLETQIENFLTFFYVKAVEQGLNIMTDPVESTDSEAAEGAPAGASYFEARLAQDPAKFFFEIMSTGPASAAGVTNPSLIIANEALNFALSSDMTQKRISSIVYHELVKNRPVAELMFTSMCCPFVQYKMNMINSILGWVLPMSSINALANRYVASFATDPETGGPIKRWILKEGTDRALAARAIGSEVQMAMPYTELRQAIMVDAIRLGTLGLAFALLGCAAFEPPEDDKGEPNENLMGNIEEWTLFGHRIGANWWLQDTLGLSLPLAAMYKATSLGYHRIDILTNGMSRVLYLNPAMKLSDAINAAVNPDYEMADYTLDCKMAANAADGGAPDKLDWFLNSWQAAGLSWMCQFVTPGIVKELYNSSQPYEKSYKRVVRTDEGGHAILDNNGQYQYVTTDYTDMALRRAARKNPVMGMVLNLIKHPTGDETGYLADQMPNVVYYDQLQMEMMEKYSLYERNEFGEYVLKDNNEVQANLLNIIATLQQYDDMKELASTGFYLDYNTKAYVSKWISDLRQSLKDMYYNDYDAGAYSEYMLGEGNYALGQYLANGIQNSYWDEMNYWYDFYKNKLWSKDLGNRLQEYYRYNTTYLRDRAGNYYASGYRKDIFNFAPFSAAPDEGFNYTSGADSQWASISAVTGEPMYDENGLPTRALIPQPEATLPTPDIDSWQNYDVNNPSSNQNVLTYGNAGNGYGNGSQYGGGTARIYGGRSSGGGGSRSYSRSGSVPAMNDIPKYYGTEPEQIYSPKQYKNQFDYLRPSYQTKGSREAYRREDF